jgi:hypothetical protein
MMNHKEEFQPGNAIYMNQILHSMTIMRAKAGFDEDKIEISEAGKASDLEIFDRTK